jgi:hypothetical protein
MILIAILTQSQKEQLQGQEYTTNSYFNPIMDVYNNWVISKEEIDQCTNENFIWVKQLPLSEYKPKLNTPPTSVALWQLRAQLAIMNLEDDVTNAINALSSSTQEEAEFKIKAKYAWDYSNNIERNSPTVTMIQGVLGLTDNEVDDIFIEAYKINI